MQNPISLIILLYNTSKEISYYFHFYRQLGHLLSSNVTSSAKGGEAASQASLENLQALFQRIDERSSLDLFN